MALFLTQLFRGARFITEETDEARLIEAGARIAAARQLVDEALAVQSDLEHDDRDLVLTDLCLELRSALAPSTAGSQVSRGRASVPTVSDLLL